MVAQLRPTLSTEPVRPHFDVGDRVGSWTVTERIPPPEGVEVAMEEALAADAAGAVVILRSPNDLEGAKAVRDEAALAQWHLHEAIVQTVAVVDHKGWPVQVIEFVDGVQLEALTQVRGALSPAAVARIGRQIASALADLHSRKPAASHGALSGERVVIDTRGVARLLDLGRVFSEPSDRHTSPERFQATVVDQRAPTPADDIYALGVILVEAALGRPLDTPLADVRVLEGPLPSRLVDALAVLVGPLSERLTNAGAAARIFTDLERHFGDGSTALRSAVEKARAGEPFPEVDAAPAWVERVDSVARETSSPRRAVALASTGAARDLRAEVADDVREVTVPDGKNPLFAAKPISASAPVIAPVGVVANTNISVAPSPAIDDEEEEPPTMNDAVLRDAIARTASIAHDALTHDSVPPAAIPEIARAVEQVEQAAEKAEKAEEAEKAEKAEKVETSPGRKSPPVNLTPDKPAKPLGHTTAKPAPKAPRAKAKAQGSSAVDDVAGVDGIADAIEPGVRDWKKTRTRALVVSGIVWAVFSVPVLWMGSQVDSMMNPSPDATGAAMFGGLGDVKLDDKGMTDDEKKLAADLEKAFGGALAGAAALEEKPLSDDEKKLAAELEKAFGDAFKAELNKPIDTAGDKPLTDEEKKLAADLEKAFGDAFKLDAANDKPLPPMTDEEKKLAADLEKAFGAAFKAELDKPLNDDADRPLTDAEKKLAADLEKALGDAFKAEMDKPLNDNAEKPLTDEEKKLAADLEKAFGDAFKLDTAANDATLPRMTDEEKKLAADLEKAFAQGMEDAAKAQGEQVGWLDSLLAFFSSDVSAEDEAKANALAAELMSGALAGAAVPETAVEKPVEKLSVADQIKLSAALAAAMAEPANPGVLGSARNSRTANAMAFDEMPSGDSSFAVTTKSAKADKVAKLEAARLAKAEKAEAARLAKLEKAEAAKAAKAAKADASAAKAEAAAARAAKLDAAKADKAARAAKLEAAKAEKAEKAAKVEKAAVVKAAVVAPVVEAPAKGGKTKAKLVIGGVSELIRARAELAVRACPLQEGVVGVVMVSGGEPSAVKTEPKNACIAGALKRTLTSFNSDDGEPFEVILP